MTFDRSKLKGTKVSSLRTQKEELESKQPRIGARLGYHSIDEGKNIFRIYPGHIRNGEQDPFVFPKSGFFLPIWTDDLDEQGNVKKDDNGKSIRVKKPKFIFDGRVHGNLEKDIVQEYINKIFKSAYDDIQDEDAREEFLLPVKGSFKKKVNGILNRTSWVCYAAKIPVKNYNDQDYYSKHELKRLEFKKSVQDELNKLADVDDADDPMAVEPFTDPDEGLPIQIKYDKSQDPNKMYQTTLLFKTPIRLTDEHLETWAKQDPLAKMFGDDVYTKKDFGLALEGLQNFDEEHGFGLFADEEFLSLIEDIMEKVPDADEDSSHDDEIEPQQEEADHEIRQTKASSVAAHIERDAEEEEEDDEVHNLTKMNRHQLKAYILEQELPIIVKKGDSDADIRKKILIEMASPTPKQVEEDQADKEANEAMPWNDEQNEKKHKETVAKHQAAKSEKSDDKDQVNDRLAKLKERMKR